MDKNFSPLHLIPNDLSIGDKDLFQCAEAHGTPCYIYDLKWVSKRWHELKEILPDGAELCYSMKTNPNHRIIETLNAIGSHFDAASIGEISRLLELGVNPQKVYYIAPGKLLKDIEEAILAGVKTIVVDSPGEVTKVVKAADLLNRPQAIMFRLNPGKRSRGSLSMAGSTQFGMMKQDIMNCWQTLLKNDKGNVTCIGLHCFQGTNIFDSRHIGEEFRRALVDFSDIAEQVGTIPQYVDVGGGFGSPIHAENRPIDIADLRRELTSVFSATNLSRDTL
jgi:diaminopimelate decarboxylase